MSISTTAPDRRRLGGENGVKASTSVSSSEVSRMFGTFKIRSVAMRFALANADRKYSIASLGIAGHGFMHSLSALVLVSCYAGLISALSLSTRILKHPNKADVFVELDCDSERQTMETRREGDASLV